MSKPAAAREGQPQHQTKITVVGAEGRAAADAIGRYHAQLAHFQAAEQQRLLLSPEGVNIHRGYATFEGATAVYTNSFGQETIVLRVNPEHEEHPEPVTNPDYWDFVLIETEVAAGNSHYAEFSAWLVTDRADPIVGYDDGSFENSSDGILRYPDDTTTKSVPDGGTTSTETKYVSSLLVDLRGFQHEGATAEVDMHGRLSTYVTVGLPTDTSLTYTVISSASHTRFRIDMMTPGVYGMLTDATSFALLQAAFPSEMASVTRGLDAGINLYVPSSGTTQPNHINLPGGKFFAVPNWRDTDLVISGTVWQPAGWSYGYSDVTAGHTIPGDAPNVYTDQFAGTRSNTTTDYWPGTSIPKKGVNVGIDWLNHWDNSTGTGTVPDPPPQSATSFDVTMWDQMFLYLPVCRIGGKKPAKMRYVFFKGNPMDAKSFHTVTVPGGTAPDATAGKLCCYYLWEHVARPGRFPMRETKDAPLVEVMDKTGTQNLANRWGLPKMGTVSINPLRGRESVVFKAA